MKKLLVLMLVLGIGSIASASLMHGIVEWTVDGGQLIGTGTAMGTYNGSVDKQAGLVAPAAGDSGKAGLMNAAGNLGGVQDFGVVYNVHAEHLAAGAGAQAPGVWFVFDILGVGDVDILDGPGAVAGTIAVPEPISLALLGLGGLFLRRRK